jgi:large subunit ribosomal protein L22
MEAVAKLRNYPTSPRKMRLLADEIRGMKVENAIALLEHHPQHSATPLRKLVLSAVSNWKAKNEGSDVGALVVKTIFVDGARSIKRMLPAGTCLSHAQAQQSRDSDRGQQTNR